MTSRHLELEMHEEVAVVAVNRPEALNALDSAVLAELEALMDQLGGDPFVGVVILTGRGEKAFVAGADIAEIGGLEPGTAREFSRFGQRVFDKIERFPKPVVAAINGFCLGGGCELALACHIRIASETARLGQPEVKLGLIPGFGGTQRLPRLIGKARALELILTGEMISANEALGLGLVNRVVAPEKLMPTCLEIASRILASSRVAVRSALDAVHRGAEMPVSEALAYESALFGLAFAGEDAKEGTQAFLSKRKPEFKGR